ncbi:GAF domain-containing sensor histidine kinase [Phenylobacterium sp. J367]|uniref:GAF domain-containing sensor histidine kinase n=1 Tax=Phenylobacterium sp. J367 TaxID=2898435 RepID=UPI002151D231|nr:GAF domain-containing sensor histidine kinase [Phenylobacterium sp. J367]MCR5879778.1 GAF domain-containing sensor histidine kinase [Phenylobacterium sp. J367]
MPLDVQADVAAIASIDAVPKLLEVICRSTGMGFAAVARVTDDRWVACAVRDEIAFGLEPGSELDVVTTICDEIRASGDAVVIDHVDEDAAFRGHATPAQYGFQSYISVPIRYEGEFFGTLCAIDPKPRALKASTALKTFELFAELIGAQLAAQRRLEISQQAVVSAHETAELREQFIAVLGHDLRNPLASIAGGLHLLRKAELDARAHTIVQGMGESVDRIAGLIDNLLDLARGRLGGGFHVDRRADADLQGALTQVVRELQLAHQDREIRTDIRLPASVEADARRLAQLLSNLLANALTHGSPTEPIRVQAGIVDGRLEISVVNGGEPIPEVARAKLFQPFSRSSVRPRQEGLGLGLWICAQIAAAHGGELSVESDETRTRFSFRMPVGVETSAGAPVAMAE